MHDEIQHAHFVAGLHIKTSAPTCKAMWLAEWRRYGSDTVEKDSVTRIELFSTLVDASISVVRTSADIRNISSI